MRATLRLVIVLFDLDGTVLRVDAPPGVPGPGRRAMGRACLDRLGVDPTARIRFAGGTDLAIARALIELAGAPADSDAIDALLEAYLGHLEQELRAWAYLPIGAVDAAVEGCARRGAIVGLATGNVRRGAAMKLASAGLAELFDLARGGYGCDHPLRAEVVRTAIARCGAGDRRDVVVVGDTVHDVDAARAVSAAVVGVAVSPASRRELEEAGADAIVDACGDELVEAIFEVSARARPSASR
jgi:phosphoglycolate phosphatase-like HAD superfamily hydrolase